MSQKALPLMGPPAVGRPEVCLEIDTDGRTVTDIAAEVLSFLSFHR